MSYDGKSEEEIVGGCKKQERAAQNALYKLFFSKMNAVSYRYLSSYDDAKDVVHDSFILIFDKINSYNGTGSIEGWIRKIVVNKSVDFLNKSNKRWAKVSEEEFKILNNKQAILEDQNASSSKDDSSIYSAGLTKEEIIGAIDLLKEEYKVVFNLSVIDEFSHKNIAELINISEELSRIRLKRARTALQAILKDIADNKKNGQLN